SQTHPHDPHAESEDTLELLILPAPHLDVGHLLKTEYLGVEGDGPVRVGHGHANGAHRANNSLPGGDGGEPQRAVQQQGRRERQDQRELSALHASRSLRWSATRSALAMMVRAGFTAALDGKKLPSTT